MRSLLIIFTLIFAAQVSAQSPSVLEPFIEGTKNAKAGNFERALAEYREAFDAVKSEMVSRDFLARLHYNLGVCDFRLGHHRQAIEHLTVAVNLKEGSYARAFYALGMAESANRNWLNARQAFLGSLRSDSTNGETWFDLAFVYLAENDIANAETAFRNAVAYKSVDSPLGHNNIGVILAARGEVAAAIKEFETAIRSGGGKLNIAQTNLEYCQTIDKAVVSQFRILDRNNSPY